MNQPNGQFDQDDSFDKFFRPSGQGRMDDITDPGVPSASVSEQRTVAASVPGAQYHQQPYQGSGYVDQPPQQPRRGSALLPLLILGASLAVLALVGFLFLNKGDSSNDAGKQTQLPTQTSSQDSSQGSSSSPQSSSSSSTTPLSYASLPNDQGERCSSLYTTSSGVTCGFADRILAQAQNIPDNTLDRRFSVTSATTGRQYGVTCNRPTGQYITCSWPGTSGTGYVYIVPNG